MTLLEAALPATSNGSRPDRCRGAAGAARPGQAHGAAHRHARQPCRGRAAADRGGADVNAKDNIRDTPFLYAGAEGRNEILQHDPGDRPRQSSRHQPLRRGRADTGRAPRPSRDRAHPARTDIDIDHVNNLGWTALIEAVILGDGGPVYQEIVGLLVDAGARSIPDRDGTTPLAHARRLGYPRSREDRSRPAPVKPTGLGMPAYFRRCSLSICTIVATMCTNRIRRIRDAPQGIEPPACARPDRCCAACAARHRRGRRRRAARRPVPGAARRAAPRRPRRPHLLQRRHRRLPPHPTSACRSAAPRWSCPSRRW